jgi:hypothetical protein
MDKLVYVVSRPTESSLTEFSAALCGDLGQAVAKELPTGARVRVRLRGDLFTKLFGSRPLYPTVPFGGQEVPVDGVIDVLIPDAASTLGLRMDQHKLDSAHRVMEDATSTYQGWRVAEVSYANNLGDGCASEDSGFMGGGAFIRRVDGMTSERFSVEWHIHGVHENARRPESHGPRRYIQNRVVEPVTPTSWIIDGYEEALVSVESLNTMAQAEPPAGEEFSFDSIAAGPGEIPFFRMPCLLLFGYEYPIEA